MNQSVNYLENTEIQQKITSAKHYRKSAITLLRLPLKHEIGQIITTLVKDGDAIRIESQTQVKADDVIARNADPIGQNTLGEDLYNQWPVNTQTIIKNYGEAAFQSLTGEFTPHKKQATVQAIEITEAVLETLGVEGDTLNILVSWSDIPMIAKLGDFITSGGYSISAHDMKSYEQIA